LFVFVQKLKSIGNIKPETDREEHTKSVSSTGINEDSAGVQNVISDEMLASKSAEGIKSTIDLASPASRASTSSSADADSVSEAKVDADVEVITDSLDAAAESVTDDGPAVDDKDQSSTKVQQDYYSAGSVGNTVTQHGRSVLPKFV